MDIFVTETDILPAGETFAAGGLTSACRFIALPLPPICRDEGAGFFVPNRYKAYLPRLRASE